MSARERPWQRTGAGSYRSSDGRFEIQSGGAGRWFLVDEQEQNELGLPLTLGPFATLDAAKEAADAQRGQEAKASPLAKRLAEAAARPRESASAAATKRPKQARERGPAHEPAAAVEPVKPRTWLEELGDRDRAAAGAARAMVTALVAEGLTAADADDIVREAVLHDRPVIAERRLARAVGDAIDKVVAPARIRRLAQRLPAGGDPASAASSLGRAVADELVEELAAVLRAGGGHHALLPGWALVERPAARGNDDRADDARQIRLHVAEEPRRPSD